MNQNKSIILSHGFIISLVLLLLNDFILKDTYNNWFTGKLSDFTGLFLFTLFWAFLFPNNKKTIGTIIAFSFIWWKSSLSTGLISYWNELFFNIVRVVDYTDLTALISIPLALTYSARKNLPTLKIKPIVPLTISCFAFCATSYSTTIDKNKHYNFNLSKKELIKRIYIQTQVLSNTIPVNEIAVPKDFLQDTSTVFIKDDFCFKGFEATIQVKGNNTNSKLELFKFQHDCPENERGKDGKKDLNYLFEKNFIEQLKN